MRRVLCSILLGLAAGCAAPEKTGLEQFDQPNTILRAEIQRRIDVVPMQRDMELLLNVTWLATRGEPAIPQLVQALENGNPKIRSHAAWALGRIRDVRTVPFLEQRLGDPDPVVELEVASALLNMNNDRGVPALIAGLGSADQSYRYRCHEDLRAWSGMDLGYDHMEQDPALRETAVRRWMAWWNDKSGCKVFPVAEGNGIPAAPAGL